MVKPREHFYLDITMTPRNCPIQDRPMNCNSRIIGVLSVSEEVRKEKKRWLARRATSIAWDEIHLVKYGTPKHSCCRDINGVIFDDNEKVRETWRGKAFNEKQILDILKQLL